jgi:hypothetical protein
MITYCITTNINEQEPSQEDGGQLPNGHADTVTDLRSASLTGAVAVSKCLNAEELLNGTPLDISRRISVRKAQPLPQHQEA